MSLDVVVPRDLQGKGREIWKARTTEGRGCVPAEIEVHFPGMHGGVFQVLGGSNKKDAKAFLLRILTEDPRLTKLSNRVFLHLTLKSSDIGIDGGYKPSSNRSSKLHVSVSRQNRGTATAQRLAVGVDPFITLSLLPGVPTGFSLKVLDLSKSPTRVYWLELSSVDMFEESHRLFQSPPFSSVSARSSIGGEIIRGLKALIARNDSDEDIPKATAIGLLPAAGHMSDLAASRYSEDSESEKFVPTWDRNMIDEIMQSEDGRLTQRQSMFDRLLEDEGSPFAGHEHRLVSFYRAYPAAKAYDVRGGALTRECRRFIIEDEEYIDRLVLSDEKLVPIADGLALRNLPKVLVEALFLACESCDGRSKLVSDIVRLVDPELRKKFRSLDDLQINEQFILRFAAACSLKRHGRLSLHAKGDLVNSVPPGFRYEPPSFPTWSDYLRWLNTLGVPNERLNEFNGHRLLDPISVSTARNHNPPTHQPTTQPLPSAPDQRPRPMLSSQVQSSADPPPSFPPSLGPYPRQPYQARPRSDVRDPLHADPAARPCRSQSSSASDPPLAASAPMHSFSSSWSGSSAAVHALQTLQQVSLPRSAPISGRGSGGSFNIGAGGTGGNSAGGAPSGSLGLDLRSWEKEMNNSSQHLLLYPHHSHHSAKRKSQPDDDEEDLDGEAHMTSGFFRSRAAEMSKRPLPSPAPSSTVRTSPAQQPLQAPQSRVAPSFSVAYRNRVHDMLQHSRHPTTSPPIASSSLPPTMPRHSTSSPASVLADSERERGRVVLESSTEARAAYARTPSWPAPDAEHQNQKHPQTHNLSDMPSAPPPDPSPLPPPSRSPSPTIAPLSSSSSPSFPSPLAVPSSVLQSTPGTTDTCSLTSPIPPLSSAAVLPAALPHPTRMPAAADATATATASRPAPIYGTDEVL